MSELQILVQIDGRMSVKTENYYDTWYKTLKCDLSKQTFFLNFGSYIAAHVNIAQISRPSSIKIKLKLN